MGCFNTKGFFSKLDIGGCDKAFVLICTQYSKPLEFKDNGDHKYVPTGDLQPITFPIFGEYDSYGCLENIREDFNTKKLESIIGDSVKNFLDIIYDITVFPRCVTKEQIDKYNQYKQALFIYPGPFPGHILNNLELTWTMDHEFVYNTLGSIYLNYIHQDFNNHKEKIFGSLNSIWCNFRKIWSESVYEYEMEISQFLGFCHYLYINYIPLSNSYDTNQDIEWDEIAIYTNALNEFVQKKQRGEI